MSYLITAYYALAAGFLTLGILPRPIINSRLRLGLPVVVLALGAAGWVLYRLTGQDGWAINLTVITLGAGWGVRRLLPQWSFIASQLFAVLVLAGLCYLGYTVDQAAHDPLGPIVWVGSAILFCFELAVFCLGLSYAFELLDVLGRRDQPEYFLDADHLPLVVLQVPTYNEPVEVVERTLRSLGGIDYPNLLIQVVDNNTPDPVVWQPLRDLCASLGSRFKFIHLEPWPGYKAGALNEATRQLHPEVEIVGIVDADYVVRPGFLKATVPYFADPQVAFVQTPQHYRDWEDNPYLRGLFQSYRYFFDITMPARAHRNAIIFAGTMGLIRRSVLEGMGGWNPDTVTEDAEASLRMLGSGYNGVYVRQAWGEGLMPLSFDGLKKQRFRWALGGVQILRQHWREMIPLGQHKLRLTVAQRLHYLLGSVQWFGDLLNLVLTVLLVATAITTALHGRLPVRQITGPLVLVPVIFLLTGIGRAIWGIRLTSRCGFGDACRALMVWFALSWVVALACLRGLIRPEAAFLVTPKQKDGDGTLSKALRASRFELALAIMAIGSALLMVVRAPGPATIILGVLLIWQASLYGSAIWASVAAEGITMTPLRTAFRRSSQNTGEWPERVIGLQRLAIGALSGVAVTLVALLVFASPAQNNKGSGPGTLFYNPPPEVQQAQAQNPSPSPSATPTPSPTLSPTATPTASPTVPPSPSVPLPKPTTPAQSPSPRQSAGASPTAAPPNSPVPSPLPSAVSPSPAPTRSI